LSRSLLDWGYEPSPFFASFHPVARCAPSSFPAIPGWFASIPRWYQASLWFVREGFWHILGGTRSPVVPVLPRHPFRRFRALVPVVTAFTVAHSVTLIASAYDLAPDALWFPAAHRNAHRHVHRLHGAREHHRRQFEAQMDDHFRVRSRSRIRFSFALRQTLQFAGSHLLTSLLSFNIGVELGQLLVLVLAHPGARNPVPVRRRRTDRHDHPVWAHHPHRLALDDRACRQVAPVPVPVAGLTAALMVSAIRWMMVIVVLAGLLWLVMGVLRHPPGGGPSTRPPWEPRNKSQGHLDLRDGDGVAPYSPVSLTV